MGLDAQVIGVGPYSGEVASSLEYGASFYAGVAPRTVVVTNVSIAATSEASHKLASAFGVGGMDLGKHKLDPYRANFVELTDIFGEGTVAQFRCLARNGFDFFYLPNA
jgi:hypothetical protein